MQSFQVSFLQVSTSAGVSRQWDQSMRVGLYQKIASLARLSRAMYSFGLSQRLPYEDCPIEICLLALSHFAPTPGAGHTKGQKICPKIQIVTQISDLHRQIRV